MKLLISAWIRKLFGNNEEEIYIREKDKNIPKEDKKKEDILRNNIPSPTFKVKDPHLRPQDFHKPKEKKILNFKRRNIDISHVSEPSRDPSFTDEKQSSSSSNIFIAESENESLDYGSDTRKNFNNFKAEIYEYMMEYGDINYDYWTKKSFTKEQEKLCDEAYRRNDLTNTIITLTHDERLKNLPKHHIIAWVAWRRVCQILAK